MITEYVSQVSDNHVVASTPPPRKVFRVFGRTNQCVPLPGSEASASRRVETVVFT